jgi:hypothetical protein
MTCAYLWQLIVLLKNMGPTIHLALTAHQTPTSLDGAGLRGLNVDCMKSSSNYFAYLCIPASETMHHPKKISIADQSHLQQQPVETNCKNKPC